MRRKLTREDVAFTLKALSDGVELSFIAWYVYGITREGMKSRLRAWGVTLDGGEEVVRDSDKSALT